MRYHKQQLFLNVLFVILHFTKEICIGGSRALRTQEIGSDGLNLLCMSTKPDGHVKYQCIKSMAELESNIDGSLSIKKLSK